MAITLNGTTGITAPALDLDTPLPVADGGTGSTSTTFVNAATNITGTLPVANGGTGATTQTAYAVLAGGTTSTGAYQSIASVGTSGQVLTSNGAGALPTFQTAAAGGQLQTVVFASSSTWTAPAGVTKALVYIAGGGGGCARNSGASRVLGGSGGRGIAQVTVTPGTTYTITIGNGGTGTQSVTTAGAGTSSSFGSLVTATGGGGGIGTSSTTGTDGTVTTTGTYINRVSNNGTFSGNLNSGTTNAATAYTPTSTTSVTAGRTGDEYVIECVSTTYTGGCGGAIMIQYIA